MHKQMHTYVTRQVQFCQINALAKVNNDKQKQNEKRAKFEFYLNLAGEAFHSKQNKQTHASLHAYAVLRAPCWCAFDGLRIQRWQHEPKR